MNEVSLEMEKEFRKQFNLPITKELIYYDLKKNGTKIFYIGENMQDLRIRKLTPKECFRLMGVKDEDFEKCDKNQGDSSLYHLAGDSIVVDVIKFIFNELI